MSFFGKISIVAAATCVLLTGCSNPMGVDHPVDVYLYLQYSGYSCKIYCENQMVSYMDKQYERDTITVPNKSQLKARIYHNGVCTYKTIDVSDKLCLKLP